MSGKILLITIIAGMMLAVTGCKKRPAPPPRAEVKSAAQYEAEANEAITKENMVAELDKIEKEVDKDANAEPAVQ